MCPGFWVHIKVITARLFVLMVEQSYSCEAHCHAVFVACLDNIVIADRTTRLCDILDAALVSALDIVAEWEESIRTEADILHLVKPCTLLLTGKYRRLLGEEFLPGAVGENIHVFVAHVYINRVVTVSSADTLLERKGKNLRRLT